MSEKCQKKFKKDRGFWLLTPTEGIRLRTRPDELKFRLWSRLSEKFQKKIRRTAVCGFGLRLRTRPDELKFQLWSSLSEKFQQNLRRTVDCGFGLRLKTPLRTRPDEL